MQIQFYCTNTANLVIVSIQHQAHIFEETTTARIK